MGFTLVGQCENGHNICGCGVSQQVLFLVRAYLARTNHMGQIKTPAEVLLELSGSWDDPREAHQIIEDLRSARKSSKKLIKGF